MKALVGTKGLSYVCVADVGGRQREEFQHRVKHLVKENYKGLFQLPPAPSVYVGQKFSNLTVH